jgi:hypothetical protein
MKKSFPRSSFNQTAGVVLRLLDVSVKDIFQLMGVTRRI